LSIYLFGWAVLVVIGMYDTDVLFTNEPFSIVFFAAFSYFVMVFIFLVDGFVFQTTSMEYIYNKSLLASNILFQVTFDSSIK
jgi:hypothetical protein